GHPSGGRREPCLPLLGSCAFYQTSFLNPEDLRRSIDSGSRIRDNHSENSIYERFPLQSFIVIVLR
ncbi:MAG: hypothetical protein KKH02_02840, partial [Proteobacteria bacterium]|nr:hypothetical protein [Pseudomonadota bacterium]